MEDEIDEDEIDEEEVWDGMCAVAAKMAGVSTERVKAIAEMAGLHAYGHAGIVDLIEAVAAATTDARRNVDRQ